MEFWAYYRVLKRWWWLIAATTVAAIAIAFVAQPMRGNDFEATATLTVPSDERGPFMVSGLPPETGAMRDAAAFNLLRSRELAGRVVKRFGFDLRPVDLQRRVSIVKDQGTDLVRVTVTGRTPSEAIALTNAVAESAVAYDQEVQSRTGSLAREFVEKQVDEVRANLRKAEEAFLVYKQSHEMELSSPRSAQLASLQVESQRGAFALSEVEAKLALLRARMGQQSATRTDQEISDNPIAQQLRGELVGLEVSLTSELALHTEKYPSVVALKAKIEAVKDRLNSELKKTVSKERTEFNPVYDTLVQNRISLETQKVALLAQKEAIDGALAQARSDLPGVDQVQLQQSRLTRNIEVLSKDYSNLRDRLLQARLKELELQDLGSLAVAMPAATATPVSPWGLLTRLLFAAVLGMMVGGALALGIDYMDNNSLKSPVAAERLLGLSVLAAIPRHNRPFEEAYQLLRVNVTNRESKLKPPNVMAVMSPTPGEGASTVVAGLARAFARSGRQTIVVDASLQRPAQHEHFGIPNEKGLKDVLAGASTLDEALAKTDDPNLCVLPSGGAALESVGLLGNRRMADLLGQLQQRGEVILVDTVPAIFADASAVASLASSVVLVIDATRSRRGLEEPVKTQLDSIGTRVVGVVLTKVKPDRVPSYVHQSRLFAIPRRGLSPLPVTTAFLLIALWVAAWYLLYTPANGGFLRGAMQWASGRLLGVGL
jgi:polysaccharide biosynthesis transport protein